MSINFDSGDLPAYRRGGLASLRAAADTIHTLRLSHAPTS